MQAPPRKLLPLDQLALDLRRETSSLPAPTASPELLRALADLLLGALGETVEEATKTASAQGGADEPEDNH